MKKLLYYNPRAISDQEKKLPGVGNFFAFYKIFNISSNFVDRTQTLKMPLHTELLYPIPKFKIFTKTFEDVCNERATELLKMAQKRDCKIYTFYSGGIDSTLMMVSILKVFPEQDLSRIVVLLSEESIKENPNFYEKSIRAKLKTQSSHSYPLLFNKKDIFILAENNDQLFGSDAVADVIKIYGDTVLHKPYDRKMFLDFFGKRIEDAKQTEFIVSLFERQSKSAPIPINTNFLFLWWINFSFKWQGVTLRALSRVKEFSLKNMEGNRDYLMSNYLCFYNTDDFQLWSLNNPDKRIKDKWSTYKYVCKDIIYDYTKDAEYRDNKLKIGSLSNIMRSNVDYKYIDESFTFFKDFNINEVYNPDNDFK